MNDDTRFSADADSPEGWGTFAEALRSHAVEHPTADRSEAMEAAVIARTTSRKTRPGLLATLAGSSLLVVAVAFLFDSWQFGDVRPFEPTPIAPVHDTVRLRHHPSQHGALRRLPAIPPAALETNIDTALPGSPGNYSGHHPHLSPVPPAEAGR